MTPSEIRKKLEQYQPKFWGKVRKTKTCWLWTGWTSLFMITTTHIKKAKKTARYGNVRKAKMSAIAISQSGEIIASACNRMVYGHPTKYTDHCEEVLLQKLINLRAFQRYGKIKIFVMRVMKDGFGIARPCKRCQKQLDNYNVEVYYTNGSIEIGAL